MVRLISLLGGYSGQSADDARLGVVALTLSLGRSYPALGITRAIPFILELHDPATNKGTALEAICKHLGLSAKKSIVFGDGENDVAMFRVAGYSVAMSNGMEVRTSILRFAIGGGESE